jgi:ABC-2 type transport system permease protein
MKGFYAALYTEIIKSVKSSMLWIVLAFNIFIAMMLGLLMLVAKHPEIAENSVIISTKASLISKADWPTFFALLLQMGLVLGSLGSGIVAIWIFGREYSDRVIKDILALPVSRFNIVLSKSIIILIWSIIMLIVLFAASIITGKLVGLESWSDQLYQTSVSDYSVASILTVLLFTPVTLVTSISRGYLLPVGFIIMIMILTQLIGAGLTFLAPYFPWCAPAVISGLAGPSIPEANIYCWIIFGLTVLLGFFGTAAWWRYADQH